MSAKGPIGIGVVGCGYWGPKHIRNFAELPNSRVVAICDRDEARLAGVSSTVPDARRTRSFADLLEADDVDAIVVATPVTTHFSLARQALSAGKHVLVEKPMTSTSDETLELIRLSDAKNLVLMVGHTFLYNPAVRALRTIIQSGELGSVYYIHSQRLNLGLFQRDVNVVWDLAPHDISMLVYLLDAEVVAVTGRGIDYVQPNIADIAYIDLRFPNRVSALVHMSWLDPAKVRRTTVVGSRKMAVYDDIETLEKIRIYDKGVDPPPYTSTFGEFQLSYRYGDISIPHLPTAEPMRIECEHFLDCIMDGTRPLTDGVHALRVIEVLEAIQRSMDEDGKPVAVSSLLAPRA